MKTLADRLVETINRNPELVRWKAQLLGGCCRRRQPDSLVRGRIADFVARWPKWRGVLEPLLKDDDGGNPPVRF